MMFKRLFWMSIGAWVGLWSRSKVLRAVEQYVPAPLRRAIKRVAKNIQADIKERYINGISHPGESRGPSVTPLSPHVDPGLRRDDSVRRGDSVRRDDSG